MKKGFTLIELLVVVLIIGILSAIALPKYEKAVKRSRGTEARIAIKTWADAANIYYLENGEYPNITNETPFAEASSILGIDMPALKYFEVGCQQGHTSPMGCWKPDNKCTIRLRPKSDPDAKGGAIWCDVIDGKTVDFDVCVSSVGSNVAKDYGIN